MRICPITSYSNNYISNNRNTKSVPNNSLQSQNVTFGGWTVNGEDILKMSPHEFRELVQAFHESSDKTLKSISHVSTGFLSLGTDTVTTERAFQKVKRGVEGVKREKARHIEKIAELTQLQTKQDEQIFNEKLYVIEQFINLIRKEQEDDIRMPITNGILISGSLPDKKEFVDWLIKESEMNYAEVTYDKNDPLSSLENMLYQAEKADVVKNITNKRTLLYLKNFDNLLTNTSTVEQRRHIAIFKDFAESCAEEHSMTLLMTTNKSLESFEQASIAPHRFGITLNLEEIITPQQKEDLAHSRSSLDEIMTNAVNRDEKYWWSPLVGDDTYGMRYYSM